MDQEELKPELKKILSGVKLKEPPREIMANYLSEVNAKIDKGVRNAHFGFPQVAVVFAVGIALAGLFYFFLAVRPQTKPMSEVKTTTVIARSPEGATKQSMSSEIASAPLDMTPRPPEDGSVQRFVADNDTRDQASTQKPLTLEEEAAVLEAFSDELSGDAADLFGDDEALEELALLDDMELSPQWSAQTSGI